MYLSTVGASINYTLPFNYLGLSPAMSGPAGISPKGVPRGMHLVGKLHDTDTVFIATCEDGRGGPKFLYG